MKTRLLSIRKTALTGIAIFSLVTALSHSGQGGETQVTPGNAATVQGRSLFLINCAHCHGADATGDEGPDLHSLDLPDERVAKLINNGKKGEMPKFSAKLDGEQVRLLIAYLHTLK